MVPVISPENNFGNARPMISAIGVSEQRVLRVRTELTLADAAHRYDQDIAAFLKKGGKVTLGLLGLGADGHTASIFSKEDVEAGRGHYAIAATRQGEPSRVTVTADFLSPRRLHRLYRLRRRQGRDRQNIHGEPGIPSRRPRRGRGKRCSSVGQLSRDGAVFNIFLVHSFDRILLRMYICNIYNSKEGWA